MASKAFHAARAGLHVVVLDKDAGSRFVADSSVVGYDGARKVRDQERSVGQKEPNRKGSEETNQSRWGFRGMTVRDWMELLIVPLSLVVIGLVFTAQQEQRQEQAETQREQRSQDAEADRARRAQKLEQQRAEAEMNLAEQSAQDEALQAYLDQMNQLLLENDLRASDKESEVRTLARARTLTVLGRLDPSRKTAVMQFLVEAELVQSVEGREPIMGLGGADLSGADLSGADLAEADLSEANLNGAYLPKAQLWETNLSHAKLGAAGLSGAILQSANLADADLSWRAGRDYFPEGMADGPLAAVAIEADLRLANLSGANLESVKLANANLTEADLSHTKLNGTLLANADLSGTDLTEAELSEANLKDAYEYDSGSHKRLVSNEKLEEQAASLEGATMPNGSKHP